MTAARLRPALFDRLSATVVSLPSLDERPDDIPLLVRSFLQRWQTEKRVQASPGLLQALARADWPGNVRQLENVLRTSSLTVRGWELTVHDLPEDILASSKRASLSQLEELELEAVRRALHEARGNRTQAAAMLGISRATLYRKIRGYARTGFGLTL